MRLLAVAIAIAATCASIGQELELVDEVRLEDQSIAKDEAIDLALPALPAREGHVAVLTFRAVIRTEGPGGCNYNASILINGAPVSRYAAGGDERLLGRLAGLDLVEGAAPPFPVFSGDRAMMMFAPDVDTGDAMTLAGLGATFALDVTDLVSGVDGNTVTFRNLLPGVPKPGYGDLRVEAIAVGYVSRDALPQPLSDVPERGRVAQEVTQDDLHLAQSARGGFVIRAQTGHELLVETGLGMSPDTESVLIADDQASVVDGVSVDVAEWGAVGFRMEAAWPELTLERTVEIRDGLIDWRETWRNEGDVIRGVPFRHRVFLRQPVRRAHIGGSSDRLAVSGSAPNPTIFLEAPDGTGDGFGVTAESDWLRLLMGLRVRGGVGEILSETLALAPGKSVDFRLSIEPVTDGGGYWSFINGLRDRWGVNGITNERPMFWGYARAENDDPDERVAESLAHLGPITVVLGPWQRLEPDAKTVRAGRAPKLRKARPARRVAIRTSMWRRS